MKITFKNSSTQPAHPGQSSHKNKNIKNISNLIHGTGLTKKIVEKSEKIIKNNNNQRIELFKQSQQSQQSQQSNLIRAQPQEIPILDLKFEKDLVPGGLVLDPFQQRALDGILKQKYACLIGCAGTGKTTLTKMLVNQLQKEVNIIDLAELYKNFKNYSNEENSACEDGNNDGKNKNNENNGGDNENDESENVAISFSSFIGRAVQQIKRSLPVEYHNLCRTIHATLAYRPVLENYFSEKHQEYRQKKVFRPLYNDVNKLPFQIYIIDESGSVPIYLWNALFAAMKKENSRVILIGDINQLPPVQGRSVLGFAMLTWPTFTLEKIHRQALNNPIIANAHRILRGEKPINDKKRFIVKEIDDKAEKAMNKTIDIIKHLHQKGLFDPIHDAFIVPQNKSILGQVNFNEKLVHYFNPPRKTFLPGGGAEVVINPREVITAGYTHLIYAKGDKIMLLKNDNACGLTNGMIGIITDICINPDFRGDVLTSGGKSFVGALNIEDMEDINKEIENQKNKDIEENGENGKDEESQRQASHIVTVQFKHLKIELKTVGQLKTITHAYAFTCHKSQGGEYPTVVILVHSSNSKMLTREWLYTAVTRGIQRIILLYNRRGLEQALNVQSIKGNTIEEKAKCFLSLQDKKDTIQPTLPKPITLT